MLSMLNFLMNQSFQRSTLKNTDKRCDRLPKILWVIYCFVAVAGLLIPLGVLICMLIMGWEYFPWS